MHYLDIVNRINSRWAGSSGIAVVDGSMLGSVPRVHGNGFVQLDINEYVRLHVWGDPRIPRQETYTGVHDHTFGFVSHVLRGRIFQIPYSISPVKEMLFSVYEPVPRDGEDTLLVPARDPDNPVSLTYDKLRIVDQGEHYSMAPRQIHETVADMPATTLMIKYKYKTGGRARVFVPKGNAPDNTFNRNRFDTGMLWQIVRDAIK